MARRVATHISRRRPRQNYWAVEVACSMVGERTEEVAMSAGTEGSVVVAL